MVLTRWQPQAGCIEPWHPSPDIAGVGVCVGFVASAYITFILVLLHYFIQHSSDSRLDNEFRDFFRRAYSKIIGRSSTDSELIGRVSYRRLRTIAKLECMILTSSDTQIFTGIAILFSAYLSLNNGVTLHHWKLAVNLAWFSTFTHLAALTSLRSYFLRHARRAVLRCCFMVVSTSLLAVAIIPTGYGQAGIPVACEVRYLFSVSQEASCRIDSFPVDDRENYCWYWEVQTQTFDYFVTPLSITFLVFNMFSRCIRLFPTSARFFYVLFRSKPSFFAQTIHRRLYERFETWNVLLQIPFYPVIFTYQTSYLILHSIYDIMESQLSEIAWVSTVLCWNTLLFANNRSSKRFSEEDEWTFGQILSVFLLALPIYSLFHQRSDHPEDIARLADSGPEPEHLPTSSYTSDQIGITRSLYFRLFPWVVLSNMALFMLLLILASPAEFLMPLFRSIQPGDLLWRYTIWDFVLILNAFAATVGLQLFYYPILGLLGKTVISRGVCQKMGNIGIFRNLTMKRTTTTSKAIIIGHALIFSLSPFGMCYFLLPRAIEYVGDRTYETVTP